MKKIQENMIPTRQVIIVRKDLNMSVGKMMSQIGHAVMAYFTSNMKFEEMMQNGNVKVSIEMPKECYDWTSGIFTKTVCQAKNRNNLLKAVRIAESLGLKEGLDFFLIKDNCLTELEPEEFDENGVGRTLTCIGFRPLPDEIAHKISKKFHLYI